MVEHSPDPAEDARLYSAAIIKQLQRSQPEDSFCSYGTDKAVMIGIGRESSIDATEESTLDAVWAGINEYLEANSGEAVFGFIGFDPANQLQKKIGNYREKIDLFVPGAVVECCGKGWTVLKGDLEIDRLEIESDIDTQRLRHGSERVDVSEHELGEFKRQYAASAAHFIEAINAGTLERATLANKLNVNSEFDILRTFMADHNQHVLARSFCFSNKHIAFAGQCPELLAEGNLQSFVTHKLSGTYAKTEGVELAALGSRFQSDERIIAEHQSAISAIEKSLNNIGQVESTRFQLMELPTLLHGWSKFNTRPAQGVSVARCLRSIFPYGVSPLAKGFELLAKHEHFNRGPYYGLVGCVLADGEFSFTQVLRSAFVDNEGSYLMAGAAITARSTPELEAQETCNKLCSIHAYERRIL